MKHLFTVKPRTIEELNEMQYHDQRRIDTENEMFDTIVFFLIATGFCLLFIGATSYMAEKLVKFETEISRSF